MFLELKGIRKSYGDKDYRVEVLKGIYLGVEKGEFVVLLGASGSGKSTLLNIIGGIDEAGSGTMNTAASQDLWKERKARPCLLLRRGEI